MSTFNRTLLAGFFILLIAGCHPSYEPTLEEINGQRLEKPKKPVAPEYAFFLSDVYFNTAYSQTMVDRLTAKIKETRLFETVGTRMPKSKYMSARFAFRQTRKNLEQYRPEFVDPLEGANDLFHQEIEDSGIEINDEYSLSVQWPSGQIAFYRSRCTATAHGEIDEDGLLQKENQIDTCLNALVNKLILDFPTMMIKR